MLEPNDIMDYKLSLSGKEQEPLDAEVPSWIVNFFAGDDDYDLHAK